MTIDPQGLAGASDELELPPAEAIARVGNTGLSFGDHVHFEVRIDGTPVDPLPLLESKLR